MNILVLGSSGMLGHMVTAHLLEQGLNVIPYARRPSGFKLIDAHLKFADLEDFHLVRHIIEKSRPCSVINCAAITKQDADISIMKRINTNLPIAIAKMLERYDDGSRLIHISTDGVFSGKRGGYSELDPPDVQDNYGTTKFMGEVHHGKHLSIRTSIIGPSLHSEKGILDWFV